MDYIIPKFPYYSEGDEPPPHMCIPIDDSDPCSESNNYILPAIATSAICPVPVNSPSGGNIVYSAASSRLIANYSYNPASTEMSQEYAVKKMVDLAFAPIQDGNKMSRKESVDIIQNKICLLKIQEDGTKSYVEIFNGYVKDVECVTYKNKPFFRLIFIVEGRTKIGKYHDLTDLYSAKKVRTILCEGLTALEKRAADKNVLSFIQMYLQSLLSTEDDCYKSLQFGWSYYNADMIYTKQLPTELLAFSKFNKNLFLITGDTPTEPDYLILDVIRAYSQIGNEKEASILLIFSFTAMLYSLIGLPLTDTVLVLLGNPYACKRIASHFMKSYVRSNNEDAISLSEDSKYALQDYLALLHDDVTIITDNASSKYEHEKLDNIYKYARSGECKGERIQTLFVICSNELGSLNYEKQLFIHIHDNTKINFQDTAPQTFRRFIIEKIEEDSEYWCKRISQICRTNQMKPSGGSNFITASKTVCDVLLELLQSEGAGEDSLADINRFFNLGLAELKHQIDGVEPMDLVSHFRNVVADSVSDGTIKVWNRKIKLDAKAMKIIFYDNDYYYFSSEVFMDICTTNAMDKHSQYLLKEGLYETDALHTYQHLKSKLDKGYDFRYFNEDGVNARASGLSIHRTFWDDTVGGISLVDLYESMHID